MDELGNILREAREMKGLTLDEVQGEIRINARFLEALESGQYDTLPTPVHVRGYLRNYARFLDLDPDPLVERYEALQRRRPLPVTNGTTTVPGRPLPLASDQPFFDPVNVDLSGAPTGGGDSTMRLVIIVALLITIGLAASRFLNLGGEEDSPALAELITSLLSEEETEPAAADGDNLMPEATSEPVFPTERNNPDLVLPGGPLTGTNQVEAAPIATRALITLPPTLENIQIRLDITERTWMRVTIDGEIVFEDQVTQGEGPFEWEADESVNLLTGNAAGLFITVNEEYQIGKLGGRGEVAEWSWSEGS